LPMDEALDKALSINEYPVVVADQADNAGGGAPSDSTFALKALLDRGVQNAAVAMMWDPIVVHMAMAAGVGATMKVRLGGIVVPMCRDPLDLTVTVTGIVEDLIQEWPQTDGVLRIPCGHAVPLHCTGLDIVVNTQRGQVFSPMVF